MRRDGTPTQFDNVSYTKAVALQEVDIWSVKDVYEADLEDLMAAEGIGEKTAKSMKKQSEREFNHN
ncbi:helix-hairpin-helix domain-containing protein [Halobacterium salinarum]|uniref:helix-hairpin-helix domain-containing protein n=1 Tax=Halobacterium salinarum TaxID=2242 RepID=UPI0025579CBC|nr:helix-hairpin-helix domain-containing protein [Halobacterium salinarum]MDL0123100.1 helix-hairpin-helix domain-containing protein [Halobacterium salinarum]MDL0145737.1 helix-hairpin-helix domain-containing protein [Halobacterium salinarum]